MTQDDLDRIAELEEMKELGEELDEDERTELRELKSQRDGEKRSERALDDWGKAKEVYKLSFPGVPDQEPAYALTAKSFDSMAAVYKWDNADYVVEKIARPSLKNVCYDSSQKIYIEAV